MMNKDASEIAFVLDRSGSMSSLAEHAVAGFNTFLAEHQKAEGIANMTLVLFDNEYLVPVNRVAIKEVPPLTAATYVPRASTALLDAVGRTIEDLGAHLRDLPPDDRPATVIVAILTDGLENASEKFTRKEIADLIKHQTDVYKWQFMFLGANQDAIGTAVAMNIDPDNASSWVADEMGLCASTAALSKKSYALRRRSSGRATVEEMSFAASPLRNLVSEEDAKLRGKEEDEVQK